MTEKDKERLLDIVWRAMSAAANGDDIPMDAQLIADEVSAEIDRIIAAGFQDNG